ncbi:YqzE family protein [Thalassobacillus devorans]|uniref:YqzE family protein n=1 Tax=Thalassobacillus devorans TaxID=279813 RepID=A0ABQ1P5Q2_9BACI|nr:YqzE family protein [Thalassobacillus devorans]NIK29623.1 hypothetical protein [Thalassobacillus devorans]GGC91566.1 YqzE family protein [Thalassobacillus devorans]
MSGNDYVKYVTEEFVRYMNLTKEEKHNRKRQKIKQPKRNKWFGMLPFAMKMLFNRHK